MSSGGITRITTTNFDLVSRGERPMGTFDFPTKDGELHTVTADRWRAEGDEVVFEDVMAGGDNDRGFRVIGRYVVVYPQRNVAGLPTSYKRGPKPKWWWPPRGVVVIALTYVLGYRCCLASRAIASISSIASLISPSDMAPIRE